MKTIFSLLFFILSQSCLAQKDTFYVRMIYQKYKKGKNVNVYWMDGDHVYASQIYIPADLYFPIRLNSIKPMTVTFDFSDLTVPPFVLTGDMQFNNGDSILFDIDKRSSTIINKNRFNKK